MSISNKHGRSASLHDIRVNQNSQQYGSNNRRPKASSQGDFVYVNHAYVGSMNSVNEHRPQEPLTTVYREQYWACSRWPHGQRILIVLVGVLLGAVIGLALTIALLNSNNDHVIGGIFRSSAPD